jgi:hypothetical protein
MYFFTRFSLIHFCKNRLLLLRVRNVGIIGHPGNVPGKSLFTSGVDPVYETQNAWLKGAPVPGQPQARSYDTGKVIGQNGETWIKVHIDGQGNIHGVPTNR